MKTVRSRTSPPITDTGGPCAIERPLQANVAWTRRRILLAPRPVNDPRRIALRPQAYSPRGVPLLRSSTVCEGEALQRIRCARMCCGLDDVTTYVYPIRLILERKKHMPGSHVLHASQLPGVEIERRRVDQLFCRR